jgi:hypothetical protein
VVVQAFNKLVLEDAYEGILSPHRSVPVTVPFGLDFSGSLAPVKAGLVQAQEGWREAGAWAETGLGGYTRVGVDWEAGFSRPRRLTVEDTDAGKPPWPNP